MFKRYQHHQDSHFLDEWYQPGSPIHQGCPQCGSKLREIEYIDLRRGSLRCPRCGRKGGRYGLL